MTERTPSSQGPGYKRESEYEIRPEWGKQLEAFREKARARLDTEIHVPEGIKQQVRGEIELLDPQVIAAAVEENRFDLYGKMTPEQQFKTWMKINFIHRILGDIKEEVFADKNLGDGQKLMFSHLIRELEFIAEKS